jgi:hypothetical protein
MNFFRLSSQLRTLGSSLETASPLALKNLSDLQPSNSLKLEDRSVNYRCSIFIRFPNGACELGAQQTFGLGLCLPDC